MAVTVVSGLALPYVGVKIIDRYVPENERGALGMVGPLTPLTDMTGAVLRRDDLLDGRATLVALMDRLCVEPSAACTVATEKLSVLAAYAADKVQGDTKEARRPLTMVAITAAPLALPAPWRVAVVPDPLAAASAFRAIGATGADGPALVMVDHTGKLQYYWPIGDENAVELAEPRMLRHTRLKTTVHDRVAKRVFDAASARSPSTDATAKP